MEGTAMFKNREIRVRLAKTEPVVNEDGTYQYGKFAAEDIMLLNSCMESLSKKTAISVGAIILSTIGAKTISEIAIHTAKTYIK
jgi:hypothetical protein